MRFEDFLRVLPAEPRGKRQPAGIHASIEKITFPVTDNNTNKQKNWPVKVDQVVFPYYKIKLSNCHESPHNQVVPGQIINSGCSSGKLF